MTTGSREPVSGGVWTPPSSSSSPSPAFSHVICRIGGHTVWFVFFPPKLHYYTHHSYFFGGVGEGHFHILEEWRELVSLLRVSSRTSGWFALAYVFLSFPPKGQPCHNSTIFLFFFFLVTELQNPGQACKKKYMGQANFSFKSCSNALYFLALKCLLKCILIHLWNLYFHVFNSPWNPCQIRMV